MIDYLYVIVTSTMELKCKKKFDELHGLQLSYYEKAASMLFDRPCDRVAIYSTHAAKVYDITTIPLTLPESNT